MQRRRLGQSELELSALGFGSWAVGGSGWSHGWGPQDDTDSVRAIHRALDLGVNWIDTAAVYGMGHSEEIVARALRDRKGQVIVATKCGLRWRPNGGVYPRLTAKSVREEAEESLRRLQLEAIDLYQIHWPSPPQQIEEGWSEIARLVEEGKVRYAGVSNFNVDQLEKALAIHPVTSLQPPYSMINRLVEDALLPFCQRQQIGVVVYSPMQCGLLTGTFDQQRLATLDAGDWRRKDPSFLEPRFSQILQLVEQLRPFAERANRPLAQLAIAWVLRRPEVTAAIVGARNAKQIEQTAGAADWQLSDDEQAWLEQTLQVARVSAPPSIR